MMKMRFGICGGGVQTYSVGKRSLIDEGCEIWCRGRVGVRARHFRWEMLWMRVQSCGRGLQT